MKAMQEAGHEVVICTAPINEYQHCVPEKYEWVEEHLGMEWTRRMMVTKDKTLVYGDVLIDDRPEIHGHRVPQWQHVLFDQAYNRHITTTPQLGESLQDVRFLLSIGENILALRCYRILNIHWM